MGPHSLGNRCGRKPAALVWLNQERMPEYLIRLSGSGRRLHLIQLNRRRLIRLNSGIGPADILFGSTAEAAGCASFSSTAGALSGSTEEAGDILFAQRRRPQLRLIWPHRWRLILLKLQPVVPPASLCCAGRGRAAAAMTRSDGGALQYQ